LVESEFPIDWVISPLPEENGIFGNLFFISKDYMKFIEGLVKKYKPDFVVEDQGMRPYDDIQSDDDEFIAIFKRKGIPYQMVDIPEYALNYISSPIINKKELIKKFSAEIEEYKNRGQVHYNDPHFQQLVMWYEYLREDCKTQEEELRYKIRESWMMMGILELAKKQDKKELTTFFICDKRHYDGIIFLENGNDISLNR